MAQGKRMKISSLLLSLMILTGCFVRPTMMNRESFESIHLGTPVNEVYAKAGTPYQVHCLGGGKEEFEYIEKIDVGNTVVMQNRYFLIIMEGQVVSKRFCKERPPAYDFIYKDDPTLSY